MKKTLLQALLILACIAGSTALAQPTPHDKELQASAGFFHAQGSDSGSVNGDIGFGYFLGDPHWEIGLRQGFSYSFIEDSSDVWTATTIPFVNYHLLGLFESDRVVPFIGTFVGAIWNDEDITGTLGPDAGVKFFVNDSTFLTMRYRYEWFFNDLSLGDIGDNSSKGNHVGTIGLGFVWGGSERPVAAKSVALLDQVDTGVKKAENAAALAENSAQSAEGAARKAAAAANRSENAADRAADTFDNKQYK